MNATTMNAAWIMLAAAGLLEVGWAIGLKYTDGFNFRGRPLACSLTLGSMAASMYLLALAVRAIPIGTAYAIWTGIGAVGAATLGMILFKNEPATPARIACLLLVLTGIVGLKLTSGTPAAEPEASMSAKAISLYIGGYTGDANRGIYRATLDPATGAMTAPTLAAEATNPSFLGIHPTLAVLYAVRELDEAGGQPAGAVNAFRIGKDGALAAIGSRSARGRATCFVSVGPTGRLAFAANYGDGTVAAFPIAGDGALDEAGFTDQHVGRGRDPDRQVGPHAHCLLPAPGGRFALSADLGTDSIVIYRIERGTLARHGEAKLHAGAGPRHIAFAADGRFAYVANELDSSVATLAWDAARGTLEPLDVLPTIPGDFHANNAPAEIAIHPNGRFLYVSNRGHDSLAVFRVDPTNGRLAAAGHASAGGREPRHFAIEPGGRFLIVANQKSDALVAFRIDPESGMPTPAGSTVTIGAPSCVRFAR